MSGASSAGANYVALGVVVTSAPRVALLAVLQQLRPQLNVQLQEIAPMIGTGETGYRVEVDLSGQGDAEHSIGLWLQIKSVLMAQFPADKPDAVSTIDS